MVKIPFSLVTTCRNEMKSLPRWKKNIMHQTRQPDEIVIVDAFSDDGTFEFLAQWQKKDRRIKLFQEKGAAAHGRNFAIKNAKFEHILSTDMGVRLAEVWCEELIKPFERDNSVEVVAGNTCIDKETVTSAAAAAEYFIENGGQPKLIPGHIPGNRSIAYTKTVWKKVGGLPEDLTFYADDSVFGRQLNQERFVFAFAPKALTYWGRPATMKQFNKEMFNYGIGDGEALIKTPFVVKLMVKGKLPKFMVPTLDGFVKLYKGKPLSTIKRAFNKTEMSVLFYIPRLLFNRGYYHSKGYLIGIEKGAIKCKDCRNRLRRDTYGFSLI